MPPSFLLQNGIILAIVLAIVGLVFALILIRKVVGADAGNEKMHAIASAIQQGAKAYLNRQIVAVSLIAVVIFAAIWYLRDGLTAAGFVVGAVCSLAAGYIGMMIAVRANVRTAQAASVSSHAALKVAFNGGAVTGLLVVALGLLSVGVFYLFVRGAADHAKHAIDSLVGLALGSSLISVFARLGGGIYTKAADVGADLVGKNEQNLNEDDPRNPATIADNVGDNVGDCAGMAADVFETYAVSLIGGVLVGHLTVGTEAAVIYPFVLCGLAIIASLIGIGWVNFIKQEATAALVCGVAVSGIVASALFWWATSSIFGAALKIGPLEVPSANLFYCAAIGLIMTLLVVWITNYYTSTHHRPVRMIAKASETGPATNIIAGISIGNQATLLPVLAIAASIWGCFDLAGLYGIAIAVVSMLSLSGIIISLDAFGPITDNAGGIAVMSGLPESVRKITDELDAVGNTMKAVTKGYAIASAGLAAMVLFGSYVEDLKAFLTPVGGVAPDIRFDLMNPKVVIGMFIGGLLPFLFTSFCMSAVGTAAGAVVREVRRQIAAKPGILNGTDIPDYAQCVDIVTKAALGQMIVPALLPLVFVIGTAYLGMEALGGVLIGTIVTGLFVGISMTSAGGAWDNAKKFIEEGNHGGKGSFAHQAAVTGDTVGDPYKDTAGPAVNPMIKVVNILAILIIPIMFKAAVK